MDKKADKSWVPFEAERCLACYDPPCQKACPANVPVPEFIRSIKSENFSYASKIVREANPMISICGAVCPSETLCQSACTRSKIDLPIRIRELHKFATSFEEKCPALPKKETQNKRVAVIGSGPAGISAAVKLAEKGFSVTIFEESNKLGGVPNSSIPGFRLKPTEMEADIKHAENSGVEFKTNKSIKDPANLLKEFDAVFAATGLHLPTKPGIPGEKLKGVVDGITFLEEARGKRAKKLTGKRVVVVGGGNVSLDVASSASSLGASEVRLLYRRGPKEIKVWVSELKEASERGVMIDYLTAPLRFVGKGSKLTGVKCVRMELSNKTDSSGRRTVKPLPGAEFTAPADLAIIAIGLKSDYMKNIKIKGDLSTSVKGIFAGGDMAKGEGTIVEAVRDGKLAAEKIADYLKGGRK